MKNLILFLSLFFVAACSSDSNGGGSAVPGSQLPPLTTEQKGRMTAVGQELVDAQNSAAQNPTKGTSSKGGSDNSSFGIQSADSASIVAPMQVSQKGYQLEEALNEALNSDNCIETVTGLSTNEPIGDITIEDPDFQELTPNFVSEKSDEDFNLDMSVSIGHNKALNKQCPITTSFSLKTTGSQTQNGQTQSIALGIEAAADFSFTDDSFLEFEDFKVYSYSDTMKADMKATVGPNSALVELTGAGQTTIKTRPDFEGDVILKTDIAVRGGGTSEDNAQINMQMVFDYTFRDFQVVGVIRMNYTAQSEATPQYFINGDSVTESEFNGTFAQFGSHGDVLGQAFPDQTNDESETTLVEGEPSFFGRLSL